LIPIASSKDPRVVLDIISFGIYLTWVKNKNGKQVDDLFVEFLSANVHVNQKCS
jgi:hypothetical protein